MNQTLLLMLLLRLPFLLETLLFLYSLQFILFTVINFKMYRKIPNIDFNVKKRCWFSFPCIIITWWPVQLKVNWNSYSNTTIISRSVIRLNNLILYSTSNFIVNNLVKVKLTANLKKQSSKLKTIRFFMTHYIIT